jgi:hypothetical protein
MLRRTALLASVGESVGLHRGSTLTTKDAAARWEWCSLGHRWISIEKWKRSVQAGYLDFLVLAVAIVAAQHKSRAETV